MKLRLRFSLLTLLLFTAWIGSGLAIYIRGFKPWAYVRRFETAVPSTYQMHLQVTLAVLSHDTSRIFVVSEDTRVRLFNLQSGAEVWNVPFDVLWLHRSEFGEARFVDGDRFIETWGRDKQTRMYFDAATGQVISDDARLNALQETTIPPHPIAHATAKSFSPDGTRAAVRVLTGQQSDSGFELSEAQTGKQIAAFKSPDGWPWGTAFSPDSTRFATASYDCTVHVRDAKDGHELAEIIPQPKTWCYGVSFSDDGDTLAIARFHDVFVYRRLWPETPWGFLWRPEIWGCAAFFLMWLWRVVRGARRGGLRA